MNFFIVILSVVTLVYGHDTISEIVCTEDGQLHPSPICNEFYKCSYGIPVAQGCPANLLYNPTIQQCDWPDHVDCDDRSIPEAGDSVEDIGADGDDTSNNDTGNNNGGDNDTNFNVESRCSKQNSEGKLVPHEDCNKFYICNNGIPITLSCQLNLLYNPLTQQCDWPENVVCGNRTK